MKVTIYNKLKEMYINNYICIMQKHTAIYFKHFGYDISDFVPCEIPNCGSQAVDVNHIEARGMGGSKTKDYIENLMGTCREHHVQYGDKKHLKDWLKKVHSEFMLSHGITKIEI